MHCRAAETAVAVLSRTHAWVGAFTKGALYLSSCFLNKNNTSCLASLACLVPLVNGFGGSGCVSSRKWVSSDPKMDIPSNPEMGIDWHYSPFLQPRLTCSNTFAKARSWLNSSVPRLTIHCTTTDIIVCLSYPFRRYANH